MSSKPCCFRSSTTCSIIGRLAIGHHRLGLVGGERAQPGPLAARHDHGFHGLTLRLRVTNATREGARRERGVRHRAGPPFPDVDVKEDLGFRRDLARPGALKQLQVDRPDQHHASGVLMVTINESITAHLAARHLPGHPPEPAAPGQHLLLPVDVDGLPAGHRGAGGQLRPGGRHVRPGADVQPGFAIFTVFSILLSVTWMTGTAGGPLDHHHAGRSRASAGPACSPTPAPSSPTPSRPNERGMALGINGVAAIAGSFIGLILGGVLAPVDWRLVFLVSRALRDLRHGLGLPEAGRQRRAGAGHDRLVGQRHLRRRADRRADRHRVRHPALRRPHHGLDQPVRARRHLRRPGPPRRCSC